MITIQRSAGRLARNATERMRVFSWLGLAPALANVVGSVSAGVLIDHGGFRVAFAVLMLMPLAALALVALRRTGGGRGRTRRPSCRAAPPGTCCVRRNCAACCS